MTTKSIFVLTATITLGTAACGAPAMQTVQSAKSSLQGAPAERLQSCIGAPAHLMKQESQTILTYSSAQQKGPDGRTLSTPGASEDAKACVFTFTVEDGLIHTVDSKNRAGWGGSSITKCADLVKACIGTNP